MYFYDEETPGRWWVLVQTCDSSWDPTGFPGGLREIAPVESVRVDFICCFSEVLLNLGLYLPRISRGRALSQVVPQMGALLERPHPAQCSFPTNGKPRREKTGGAHVFIN